MSPELVDAVNAAIKELATLVRDDDEVNNGNIPEIHSITVEPDYHNKDTRLVVTCKLVNPFGNPHPLPYAIGIYVNTETMQLEADGY
jgi:hypothetical protein